jgi:hypothetical protein
VDEYVKSISFQEFSSEIDAQWMKFFGAYLELILDVVMRQLGSWSRLASSQFSRSLLIINRTLFKKTLTSSSKVLRFFKLKIFPQVFLQPSTSLVTLNPTQNVSNFRLYFPFCFFISLHKINTLCPSL